MSGLGLNQTQDGRGQTSADDPEPNHRGQRSATGEALLSSASDRPGNARKSARAVAAAVKISHSHCVPKPIAPRLRQRVKKGPERSLSINHRVPEIVESGVIHTDREHRVGNSYKTCAL